MAFNHSIIQSFNQANIQSSKHSIKQTFNQANIQSSNATILLSLLQKPI
ncbi:hypothetical protein VN0660_15370 [Helicobacter pylori]